jgi:hypothetical protein
VFGRAHRAVGYNHAIGAGLARIMRNDQVAMISEDRLSSSEKNLKVPRKIDMFISQHLPRQIFVIKSRSQPI